LKNIKKYERFAALENISKAEVQTHAKHDFNYNRALINQIRPQYEQFKALIHNELAKLQTAGKCIFLPRE
jgi:hypothetical protein